MPKDAESPIFLDVLRIRQPVTAMLSLGHRVSGVLLVGLIPILIWLLGRSLADADGFDHVRRLLGSVPARLLLVVTAWALAHHLLAGIRFLLMDAGLGTDLRAARRSARLVFAGGVGVAILTGVAVL